MATKCKLVFTFTGLTTISHAYPQRATAMQFSCYIISPFKSTNICLGLYFNRDFTLYVSCFFSVPILYIIRFNL